MKSGEKRQVAAGRRQWLLIAIGVVLITLAGVVAQRPVVLVLWLFDGAIAALILTAAALLGGALLPLLRLGVLTRSAHWLLSAGLGIGLLTIIVLVLGVVGLIGPPFRWLAIVLLLLGAAAGVIRLRTLQYKNQGERAGRSAWLLLALGPFLALVLLVATLPPGIAWQEEGFGYDVLEYHLELPKEYYLSGDIAYLPNNVYANFPGAAEMLYLLCAQVVDEPIGFWLSAKCLNALLGVLVVGAAWLAGRQLSPRVGIVSAILVGSAGWLIYLSGIAYVENGMLLFEMLATACILRASQVERAPATRWLVLGGLMAGFACGFKYTAVPLVVLPLAVALLVMMPSRRVFGAVAFCIASVAAFAPWLIKNTVMTGNPVFPLAGSIFNAQPPGWGEEQQEHFAESHSLGPNERSIGARLALAWEHTVADPTQRFGAILFALATVGVIRRRERFEVGLLAMLGVQLVVWIAATHLFARFAVPMLIPLALLGGRGTVNWNERITPPFCVLLLAGVAFNFYRIADLYAGQMYVNGERINVEGATAAFTEGRIPGYGYLGIINEKLPPDAHILMLGDARAFYFQRRVDYCVVFSRNPFVDAVRNARTPQDIIKWLRDRGYTNVLINWSEVRRLRHSRYGFPDVITPDRFAALETAGLKPIAASALTLKDGTPSWVLYAVPGKTD